MKEKVTRQWYFDDYCLLFYKQQKHVCNYQTIIKVQLFGLPGMTNHQLNRYTESLQVRYFWVNDIQHSK